MPGRQSSPDRPTSAIPPQHGDESIRRIIRPILAGITLPVMVANAVLFFLGLGFTGLGAVNPSTAPLWFGLAAIFILGAILRTPPVRTWLSGALGGAARRIAVRPPADTPTGDSASVAELRRQLDIATRNRDKSAAELAHLRAEQAQTLEKALADQREKLKESMVEAIHAPSRWLPDPTDPTTFTLTIDGFDDALRRATAKANDVLAPDARLDFEELSLGEWTDISFRAESELGNKHVTITVGDSWESAPRPDPGSIATTVDENGRTISVWDRPIEMPPWQDDPTVIDLIHQAGYRLRPLEGPATVRFLQYAYSGKAGRWVSRWRICVPRPGGPHPFDVSREIYYWLKDGKLTEAPPWTGGYTPGLDNPAEAPPADF